VNDQIIRSEVQPYVWNDVLIDYKDGSMLIKVRINNIYVLKCFRLGLWAITHRPRFEFLMELGFWAYPKISSHQFGIRAVKDSAEGGTVLNEV